MHSIRVQVHHCTWHECHHYSPRLRACLIPSRGFAGLKHEDQSGCKAVSACTTATTAKVTTAITATIAKTILEYVRPGKLRNGYIRTTTQLGRQSLTRLLILKMTTRHQLFVGHVFHLRQQQQIQNGRRRGRAFACLRWPA